MVTPDGAVWLYQYDPMGRRTPKQRLAKDGDAIVEVYPRGVLDGVPVHQGDIAREAEWPVELSPAELSSRASVQVPSAVAREILSEMGIHVPRKIGNGDIDPLLEYDVPKLTPEQIAHFVEEAHRRAG